MTSEMIFVPETEDEAITELESASGLVLSGMTREHFIRVWNCIAYLHPGLHPDHYDDPDGGWPDDLHPFAVEAFRRVEVGDISEDELYPSDAQWCGLFDLIAAPAVEESERRMMFVRRPMIRVGDIVRFRKPMPDEVDALLVITEWNIDRGWGKHLKTGLDFPSVQLLRFRDIEAVGHVNA